MHMNREANSRFRTLLLGGVCLFAFGMSEQAEARQLVPERPSVEVNLRALEALSATASPRFAPPVPSYAAPAPAYAPVPSYQPSPLRQMPVEQPKAAAPKPVVVKAPPPAPKVVAAPQSVPAPLPKVEMPKPVAAPKAAEVKPAPLPTPQPAAKPSVSLPPPPAPLPVVAAPKVEIPKPVEVKPAPLPVVAPAKEPADLSKIDFRKITAPPPVQVEAPKASATGLPAVNVPSMDALLKGRDTKSAIAPTLPPAEKVTAAPLPPLKPVTPPLPSTEKLVTAPAPTPVPVAPKVEVPKPVVVTPKTEPVKPAPLPPVPAPAVKVETPKPLPAPVPAPKVEAPKPVVTPPKPVVVPVAPVLPPPPSIPPLANVTGAPVLPPKQPLPTSTSFAKSDTPPLVPVAKAPPPLPPSVNARLDAMNKADATKGVVSDRTESRIAGVTVDEAKKAAQAKAEAEKKALEAVKAAEKMPPAELPPPSKPVKLTKSEMGALPKMGADAVPNLSATSTPTLPPAPTTALPSLPGLDDAPKPSSSLPSLTAITGDETPSSMDILQPKDAVDSKPLMPAVPASDGPVVKRELPEINVAANVKSAPPALPIIKTEAAPKPVTPPPAPKAPEPVKPAAKPVEAPKPEAPKASAPPAPPPVSAPALNPESGGSMEVSLAFDKEKTELTEKAKNELNSIAARVKKSQGSVRIVAYASGSAEQASIARRISLSRALQVRAFLISKGVNQLSITVQALGNQSSGGNADRADVFVK